MPKLNKIKETCLYVSDLHQTLAFYNGLLGLPLMTLNEERHVFFRVGDDVLLCFLPEVTKKDMRLPPHYASGHQHFAFECSAEDYPGWKLKLKANDIPIEHEEEWRPGVRSIYFRDPDNHCVEIVTPGLWEV